MDGTEKRTRASISEAGSIPRLASLARQSLFRDILFFVSANGYLLSDANA